MLGIDCGDKPSWVTHVVLCKGRIVFMASTYQSAVAYASYHTKHGNNHTVHDYPVLNFQI